MSINSWQETIIATSVDGAALANTTTPTSILGGVGTGASQAKVTLPANYFQVGKILRLRAFGRISTVVTTPGNFTFDVRFGGVVVANGGATALNVVAQTNATWHLEWLLICRAIGSGTVANMMHSGKWTSRASLNAPAVGTTTGVGTVLFPDTAPAVGTGFDSTASQTVDLFGTWSVANAANSIQTHYYSLESLN